MAEKDLTANFAKVIDFPKEVRIYGDVSHVYIKGKNKSSTLIIDQNSPSSSKEKKSTKEQVLIIPVQQSNGEIEFVKVPLQKLSRQPKAECTEEVSCLKVNLDGREPTLEDIPKYKMEQRNFPNVNDNTRTNHYNTCFVFQQGNPFSKQLFLGSAIPEADLFRFEKTARQCITEIKEKETPETKDEGVQVSFPTEDQPAESQRNSSKDLSKREDSSRSFLRFLVTPKRT